MNSWRSTTLKVLANRPIKESEFPRLIDAMMEDGLDAYITAEGIHWLHGSYTIQAKIIREVWGLSQHQYNRLRNYIYVENPFGGQASENNGN